MLLLGHRYYLPAIGRFLTQDPIGHEGGLNLYEYVGNNPMDKVDPTGLDAVIMWGRNKDNPSYFENFANQAAKSYEHRDGIALFEAHFGEPQKAHIFHVESMDDINRALSTKNIDTIVYFGHAGSQKLYLSHNELGVTDVKKLNKSNVLSGAICLLAGCDTAGKAPKGPNIAQAFANHFGINVTGAVGGLSFGIPVGRFDFAPGMLRPGHGMKTVSPDGRK